MKSDFQRSEKYLNLGMGFVRVWLERPPPSLPFQNRVDPNQTPTPYLEKRLKFAKNSGFRAADDGDPDPLKIIIHSMSGSDYGVVIHLNIQRPLSLSPPPPWPCMV